MNRRGFLGGLLSVLAAPAVIRTPGLLMAVKEIPEELEYGGGILTLGMIGYDMSSIIRRAFIPARFVQVYQSYPEMQALLATFTPAEREMVTFNG